MPKQKAYGLGDLLKEEVAKGRLMGEVETLTRQLGNPMFPIELGSYLLFTLGRGGRRRNDVSMGFSYAVCAFYWRTIEPIKEELGLEGRDVDLFVLEFFAERLLPAVQEKFDRMLDVRDRRTVTA